MRLHVPSLPWTQTTAEYVTCAYTQKVVKFCKMMTSLGYEVILYSGEHNEAECSKHVTVVTDEEQREWFGEFDPNDPWTKVGWGTSDPWWVTMNTRVVGEIEASGQSDDIICLISGWAQRAISACFPAIQTVEWGIGYEGVVHDHWWCFESSAWQHYVYAQQKIVNGRWYDVVIPNSFDPDDFEYASTAGHYEGDPYILFIGRLVSRKGPHIAGQLADRLGMRCVVAGPGAAHVEENTIVYPEGVIRAEKLSHEGAVGKQRRAELMAGASAVIVPTLYIEPFGGVAVEAMMCGTPVVATPWGAFNETVVPGVSGYHFYTLADGVNKVHEAMKLDRSQVRKHAERYSIENVKHEYDRWLQQVHGLWGAGWDA